MCVEEKVGAIFHIYTNPYPRKNLVTEDQQSQQMMFSFSQASTL